MSTEQALRQRADELKAERARLLREARQILDTAQRARRDFSPDEQTQWDACLTRANELERELDANLETRIAAERASPERQYDRWRRHFFRP